MRITGRAAKPQQGRGVETGQSGFRRPLIPQRSQHPLHCGAHCTPLPCTALRPQKGLVNSRHLCAINTQVNPLFSRKRRTHVKPSIPLLTKTFCSIYVKPVWASRRSEKPPKWYVKLGGGKCVCTPIFFWGNNL